MSISAVSTPASGELDLLQHVAVRVPCLSCGQHYSVSLRHVLMSQDVVQEGCPACHETACLPLTYAALADEATLREFEQSWTRLSHAVQTAGFDLTVCRPALSH